MTDIETFRGWFSTLGIWGNLAAMVWASRQIAPQVIQYLRDVREMKLREREVEREGWGDLIEALRKDVDRVRADHEHCQEQLKHLGVELEGIRRQFVMLSSNAAINLGTPSDAVLGAAERAADIVSRKDRES